MSAVNHLWSVLGVIVIGAVCRSTVYISGWLAWFFWFSCGLGTTHFPLVRCLSPSFVVWSFWVINTLFGFSLSFRSLGPLVTLATMADPSNLHPPSNPPIWNGKTSLAKWQEAAKLAIKEWEAFFIDSELDPLEEELMLKQDPEKKETKVDPAQVRDLKLRLLRKKYHPKFVLWLCNGLVDEAYPARQKYGIPYLSK